MSNANATKTSKKTLTANKKSSKMPVKSTPKKDLTKPEVVDDAILEKSAGLPVTEKPQASKENVKRGKPMYEKFMKIPEPEASEDPLGIFTPAKNMWVEHTINHVGSLPPSPYEYDLSYSDENRFLIAIPTYESVSFVAEPQRRSGVGHIKTNLILPLEFSCKNAMIQEICVYTFTTKFQNRNSCIQPRTTEFRMNVLVKNKHMGRVVQQKKSILVYDANDHEVIEVVHVPPTTGWCSSPKPTQFSSPVLIHEANLTDKPSIIGFVGRNGSDKSQCKYGKPLGFFFTSEETGFPIPDDLQGRMISSTPINNLHKVFLLGVLVGLMTKHASLKC